MTMYSIRTTRLTVVPQNEPDLLGDRVTVIELTDEGDGEFVTVTQPFAETRQGIAVDSDEWPTIRAAIDRLMSEADSTPCEVT